MTLPLKPISQTHKMKWVFWITLPILMGTLALSLLLGAKKTASQAIDLTSIDLLSSETLPALVIIIIVLLLLYSIQLTWCLNPKGFYYRYRPFINKTRHLSFEEIESITLEKINPLRDFGGWGLRYSKKHGKAYTTQGNHVIRIRLKTGKILNFTANPTTDLSA